MSTKIYYGYRLPALSHTELYRLLLAFAKKAKKVKSEGLRREFASEVATEIDKRTLEGSSEPKSPKAVVSSRILEMYRDVLKGVRNPLIDYECTVSFAPISGGWLAILFTEQAALRRLWEDFPEVTYYPYWDNTDPLEGVSEEQWEEQGRVWSSMFEAAGSWVPSESMMSFEATSKSPLMSLDIGKRELLKLIPSFEERVSSEAHRQLGDCRPGSVSEEELEHLKELLRIKLKPELTVKDL